MASAKLYNVTTFLDMKNALIDKYGVYDADTNPLGVEVYYQTTSSLIFKCSRVCDKVIRISGIQDYFTSYGDSWTTGNAVINPVVFGGSNLSSSILTGYLILSDNCMVLNGVNGGATTSDRLIVVGKLSNGKFAVIGAYMSGNTSTGTRCLITDGAIEFYPVVTMGTLLSNLGEIYKTKLYISKKVGNSEYNLDGTLAYFLDIENSYYNSIHPIIGANYFLTSGNLYMENLAIMRISNCLLIELL